MNANAPTPTGYRATPPLLRGAFAIYDKDDDGATPKIVVFQYNPEQIRRTLTARAPSEKTDQGARTDVGRVVGPPTETISMTIELDAADQIAAGDATTLEHGLWPMLATLELLLYPPSDWQPTTTTDAKSGKVQVIPAKLPLTLLVWGKSRVVPVLLTNFSVTEEAFDPQLNPINAKVDVGMKVLTYMDLDESSRGYSAFLAYQSDKQSLAQQVGTSGNTGEQSAFVRDATSKRS